MKDQLAADKVDTFQSSKLARLVLVFKGSPEETTLKIKEVTQKLIGQEAATLVNDSTPLPEALPEAA